MTETLSMTVNNQMWASETSLSLHCNEDTNRGAEAGKQATVDIILERIDGRLHWKTEDRNRQNRQERFYKSESWPIGIWAAQCILNSNTFTQQYFLSTYYQGLQTIIWNLRLKRNKLLYYNSNQAKIGEEQSVIEHQIQDVSKGLLEKVTCKLWSEEWVGRASLSERRD